MNLEIKIPSPGESVTEVVIASWLKSDGDFVEKDDELFEVESDKATLSVSAETGGVLHIRIAEGETAQVGAVAATIDTEAKPVQDPVVSRKDEGQPVIGDPVKRKPEPETVPAPPATGHAVGHASPAAQKLMAERGIKPEQISGTGLGGRITKADVLAFQQTAVTNGPPQAEAAPPPSEPTPKPAPAHAASPPKAEISGARNEQREKLSSLRLKVSERLVAVKNETAMLTTFNEVDMSEIMTLRTSYKEEFERKYGVRLGFMSIFTKAVCEALKFFPAVNAYIDGEEIVYHDYVDVGIAVQAPKGLVVPVIRNAESMTLDQIETEVARLAERARNNQLTIDEMTGGTFTISNGGIFGSLMSTPILNPPQSGILGMHKIQERPIAVDGQVVIRPMMYLAFSYDHRIIDGRESVGFLVRVKEFLENPVRMLLRV